MCVRVTHTHTHSHTHTLTHSHIYTLSHQTVKSPRMDKAGILVKKQRHTRRWKPYYVTLWAEKHRLYYFESPTVGRERII